MTTPTPTPLGPFEERLLSSLRTVVSERAAERAAEGAAEAPTDVAAPDPARDRSRPAGMPRRRRTLVAAAAAVAAAVTGFSLASPSGATPAFAVSERGPDTVAVQVNRLESPDALERAFADLGITADVTYTRPGMTCQPGRYRPVVTQPGPEATLSFSSGVGGDVGASGATLTVDRRMIRPGQTYVVETSWSGSGWMLRAEVAAGPVSPCEQVPDTTAVPAPPASPSGSGTITR